MVRKSKEVEPGGRVSGGVLDDWDRKWEVSKNRASESLRKEA